MLLAEAIYKWGRKATSYAYLNIHCPTTSDLDDKHSVIMSILRRCDGVQPIFQLTPGHKANAS